MISSGTTTTSTATTTTTIGGVKEENKISYFGSAVAKSEDSGKAKEDSGAVTSIGGSATTTAVTNRSDYQIVDNTEVKLNMNSYKMVWVTNKHGLFYKRNSISKARKVRNIYLL